MGLCSLVVLVRRWGPPPDDPVERGECTDTLQDDKPPLAGEGGHDSEQDRADRVRQQVLIGPLIDQIRLRSKKPGQGQQRTDDLHEDVERVRGPGDIDRSDDLPIDNYYLRAASYIRAT